MAVPSTRTSLLTLAAVAVLLAGGSLWLRAQGLNHSLWNVDEAIHAAVARTLLDGGVLYRDAVDQRTPASYYAVAAVFAVAGENNLVAVRVLIALLVAATGAALFVAGRRLGGPLAGVTAGALYVLLGSIALHPGDANAANTEWFATGFTSLGAALLLTDRTAGGRRTFLAGLLFGAGFLSKQPALLEVAAPLAMLGYSGWRQGLPLRATLRSAAVLAGGWLAPVLLTAIAFVAAGAWRDAVFYAWTYNLTYYGPEVDATGRMLAALRPLQLVGSALPWLLILWVAGGVVLLHRILQRVPAPGEAEGNPARVFVLVWSLAGLAAAAAGGRDYDHYTIHFLAPFSLGAGLAVGSALRGLLAPGRARTPRLILAGVGLACAGYAGITAATEARQRRLPDDPSRRVAAHIRAHSTPDDRIFVWGYHPDIYLFADRRPASRFVYASFLSGLVPWTNTEPQRDTTYAIVPGARETLLTELATRPPAFIVDCSAGPNRHWQKYPLETFPALQDLVARDYLPVDPGQFVPQGFRLFRRRQAGDPPPAADPMLPPESLATLAMPTEGPALVPVHGRAPLGTRRAVVDGRLEYFAHAPSALSYRVPAGLTGLRGGFGIHAAAHAAGNPTPTDGAEFIIRWRPAAGAAQVLLRRWLRPREEAGDRGVQSFQVTFPSSGGGELELLITPGPADVPASDWTYWTDLVLENSR